MVKLKLHTAVSVPLSVSEDGITNDTEAAVYNFLISICDIRFVFLRVMLIKQQYAIFIISIRALYVVFLPYTFRTKYLLTQQLLLNKYNK